MEKRFKSLSLFEFQTHFPDGNKCREYLSNLKWEMAINAPNVGMESSVLEIAPMTDNAPVVIMWNHPQRARSFTKVNFLF